MLSYVAKSSGMSQFFKASATAVAAAKPTLNPSAVLPAAAGAAYPPPPAGVHTPRSGQVVATSGVNTTASVRCAHTDIRIPDFTDYRRTSVKEPTSRNKDSAPARQSFTYLISGAGKKQTF